MTETGRKKLLGSEWIAVLGISSGSAAAKQKKATQSAKEGG